MPSRTPPAALRQHPWPGNVRRLKAHIDHPILFAHGHELTPDTFDFSGTVSKINTTGVYSVSEINTSSNLCTLAEIERHHIQRVLAACEGNIAKAAPLKINPVTPYKRIAEYGRK